MVETVTVVQTAATDEEIIHQLVSARLVSIPPQLLPPPCQQGQQHLQRLYLQDCNLQDAGVLTLVQSLSHDRRRRLLVLNVARNAITNVGACALAVGIPACMAERASSLYVYENEIETEGAQALMTAAAQQHVHAVWAWGNPAAPWAWRTRDDSADGPSDIVRDLSWWRQRAAMTKAASPVIIEADAPVAVTEMVQQWQAPPKEASHHLRSQQTDSISAASPVATELPPDKNDSSPAVQESRDEQTCDVPASTEQQHCPPPSTPLKEQDNSPVSTIATAEQQMKQLDVLSTTPTPSDINSVDSTPPKSPQELTTSVSETLKKLKMESTRRKIRAASARRTPERKHALAATAAAVPQSAVMGKEATRLAMPQQEVPITSAPQTAVRIQPRVAEQPNSQPSPTSAAPSSLSVRHLIQRMNQRKSKGEIIRTRASKSPIQLSCTKKNASDSNSSNVGKRSAQETSVPVSVAQRRAARRLPVQPKLVSQPGSADSPSAEVDNSPAKSPRPSRCSAPHPDNTTLVSRTSLFTTTSPVKKTLLADKPTSDSRQSCNSTKGSDEASLSVAPCSVMSTGELCAPRSAKRSVPQTSAETRIVSKSSTPAKSSSPPPKTNTLSNAKLVSLDPSVKMNNVSSELHARLQARLQRIALAPPPLPVHTPEVATQRTPSTEKTGSELGKLLARQQQRIQDTSVSTKQIVVAASSAPRNTLESPNRQRWSSARSMAPKSPPPTSSVYHRTSSCTLQSPTSPQSELTERLQQRFEAIENSNKRQQQQPLPTTMRASTSPRKIVAAGYEAISSSSSLNSFRLRKKLSLGY